MTYPDLRDECDVRTGVHRGTCALCVGEASPFAEGLLLTHFQHTEDCHANPCSCHFYEDLAVIRVALAATPEPAQSTVRVWGATAVLLGLARTYSGGKVTLDADAFDAALEELVR